MENSTNINWYPGHMAKTKRQILEDLKLIDVIVEVLDARIPVASQNPDIKEFCKNKKRVVVLNKIDLADENETAKWVKSFKAQDIPAIGVDCNSGKGVNEVIRTIKEVAKENQEKFADKGRVGKSIRIMILGIPNVGKSTFINKITNRKATQVGNKPGVTRQKQWVRVDNDIELMDTPGILWPKFESHEIGMNLAFTGTIKDDVLEKTEIAFELLKFLINNYCKNVEERFKIELEGYIAKLSDPNLDENDIYVEILDEIAKKRGAILSGGRIDYEKISGILLEEFRSGKLGKITIEKNK